MVDEDGAWKQRIEKENRRLFEPNFLYEDFMASRQIYTSQNKTHRLVNAEGGATGGRKPFDFNRSSARLTGQPLKLMRAPEDLGVDKEVDKVSRFSKTSSQKVDDGKVVRLSRGGAKKNRFNELLEVSRGRRLGSANLNQDNLSQFQQQQNGSRQPIQTPSQRSRVSIQSKVQSARSASRSDYGNFFGKRQQPDQASEVGSSLSKKNLHKLPDLTSPGSQLAPSSRAGQSSQNLQRAQGGQQRRKILSTILDRLCEMDSSKLAAIENTLKSVQQLPPMEEPEAVEDQELDVADKSDQEEEGEEFDVEQN